MDKNFFLAMSVALLVFFGYNTFAVQKEIRTRQADLSQKITTLREEQNKAVTAKKANSVSLSSTKQKEEEQLFTVETQHAKVVFTSKGAAIREFVYKDFNTDLNLTPFGTEGYFATLPDVNFEQVHALNGEDIAFEMY